MSNNQLKTNALKCDIVENALFIGKYDFPKLKRTDSIPENIIPFNCKCNSVKEKHWVNVIKLRKRAKNQVQKKGLGSFFEIFLNFFKKTLDKSEKLCGIFR